MARGHLFLIVVLLAAAALAGLLAVTRTAQSQPASAAADPAITFRMKKLDRLEASLEQQLARHGSTEQLAPILTYEGTPSHSASAPPHDTEAEDHESGHDEDRDD